MKQLIITFILINLPNLLSAQAHDKVWIVGYNGANKAEYPNYGTTFLHFEDTSWRIVYSSHFLLPKSDKK